MLSHLTSPGWCHTPPRSSASCGSLAPRPLIFLVNAIVRDTLPRTGLLFAHKTQRTHPGGEGDGGGRARTARQCTTRQAHTHTAISALPTHKARAMLTCTAVHHASGTHTHRAYETALHTKFAHIRYALTSYFSWLLPHTPPQLRFVWESSNTALLSSR